MALWATWRVSTLKVADWLWLWQLEEALFGSLCVSCSQYVDISRIVLSFSMQHSSYNS